MESSPLDRDAVSEADRRSSSTSTRASLADSLSICREALEVRFAQAATLDAFRDPILAFAKAAQREGVPPERTLALFKGMVFQLPASAWQPPDWRGDIIRQLVRMLIEDYYSRTDD
jgi:hypothetical protein